MDNKEVVSVEQDEEIVVQMDNCGANALTFGVPEGC